MVSTLSLANGLTLLFAALCLWTMALQSRGGVTTLGRVALPGGFAVLATLMLLAGVFEASILFDVLWVVAFAVGSMIGRIRGWMLSMQSNREAGLVSLPATVDGLAAALILAALSGIDFTSAMLGEALIEPGYIAAASALCAGFLGYRMLVIALRVVRPTPPGYVSRAACRRAGVTTPSTFPAPGAAARSSRSRSRRRASPAARSRRRAAPR